MAPTTSPLPAPHGPIARIVAGSLAAGLVTALVLTLVVFAGAHRGHHHRGRCSSRSAPAGRCWACCPRRFTEPAPALDRRPGRCDGHHRPRARRLHARQHRADRDELGLAGPDAGPGGVHLAPGPARPAPPRTPAPRPGRRRPGPRVRRRHVRERHRASATSTPTPPPAPATTSTATALYLDCRGQGSPTVVLDNGLGEVAASWARIVAEVDTTTRVCAYDRAGQGWSEDTDPRPGRRHRRPRPPHAPAVSPASTAPTCWSDTPSAARTP